MRELVEYIAKSLVDSPGSVEVREIDSERGKILEIKVAREDLGQIIGKQGRIAKSIRALLSAVSARNGTRYILEIAE